MVGLLLPYTIHSSNQVYTLLQEEEVLTDSTNISITTKDNSIDIAPSDIWSHKEKVLRY